MSPITFRGRALAGTDELVQLASRSERFDFLVALAGNPNTGKSTVFNALTGLRQHTGNWPGKTVSRAEGGFAVGGDRFKIVDLPGTYSLQAGSADEEVARDFCSSGSPTSRSIVVDATRLERNLNLALQILEITQRVVVCLNLMDEARRHGIAVDRGGAAQQTGRAGGGRRRPERRGDGRPARGGAGDGQRARRTPRRTACRASTPASRRSCARCRTPCSRRYPGLPNAAGSRSAC